MTWPLMSIRTSVSGVHTRTPEYASTFPFPYRLIKPNVSKEGFCMGISISQYSEP